MKLVTPGRWCAEVNKGWKLRYKDIEKYWEYKEYEVLEIPPFYPKLGGKIKLRRRND